MSGLKPVLARVNKERLTCGNAALRALMIFLAVRPDVSRSSISNIDLPFKLMEVSTR
jgi:hypothetical protein